MDSQYAWTPYDVMLKVISSVTSVAILNDNEDNFDWNKLNWWMGYAQLDKNLKDKVILLTANEIH